MEALLNLLFLHIFLTHAMILGPRTGGRARSHCLTQAMDIGSMAIFEQKAIPHGCQLAECLPSKEIMIHRCPKLDLPHGLCTIILAERHGQYPDCCDRIDCPDKA